MADAGTKAKQAVESLWKLGGLSPLQLGKNVGREFNQDDIPGRSAELAYYFFLAIFPALLMLVTILGMLAGPGSALRNALMQNMGRVMPGDAFNIVNKTLTQVYHGAGGWKVAVGLIGALWSASQGVQSIGDVLNICYEVPETRSYVRRKLIAIGLTILLGILVVIALGIFLYGGDVAQLVGAKTGLGGAFVMAWKIVQWPVALVCLSVAFGLIYYYTPNLDPPSWHWITPGSASGLLLWIAVSVALRVYLHFFNSYSATYGALGGVIILMLWFYLSGMAVLLGGEINSEIGHAQERRDKHRKELEAAHVPERRAA